MDRPAQPPSTIRSGPPDAAPGKLPAALDPDALPPGPAQRAKLLFILIVLPVIAVTLPAILTTWVFGQRAKPKAVPPARPAVADTTGLQQALDLSAGKVLPTPAALTGEPIQLTCRPERLAARAERVVQQAKSLGGEANEFFASEGEKHFYVELPAGRAEALRHLLQSGAPAASPALAPAAASPAASTSKDQVEVFIRVNQDE